jgi:phage portal protein BeeE
VTDVARFFNISPTKLHQLGRATWANLETLNREHVTACLGPWIAKRDAEVDAKLLGPGRHCRHVTDRLLIADTPRPGSRRGGRPSPPGG